MKRLVLLLVTASLLTAGCLGATETDVDKSGATNPVSDILEPRDAPLWEAPHTYPHPAFGFPTVTNPPAGQELPEFWEPIPQASVPSDIQGLELQGGNDGEHTGTGIAVFGSLAIVPNRGDGTAIYDISTPSEPQLLSSFEALGRDADTIAYPDGRLVVVLATDSGIVPVWDITDPEDPMHLRDLEPTDGSHNVDVVPGTPILYNANSDGGQNDPFDNVDPSMGMGVTEIFDLSNPDDIRHVQDFQNGYGCHDITFFVTEDKQRAYCAGKEFTQIWDITDPLNPEVLTNIPVHHGMQDAPAAGQSPVRFSHLAMVNQDASVLIVGDETGGGAAPACDVHAEAGGQSVSGVVGNMYFYDITDESNPELLGWFNPGNHLASNPEMNGPLPTACTAHFGKIIPQEDRDLMAIGFYGAGVVLVDFTDPENPVMVDQFNDGTEVWDVWYVNGWLFTGDQLRGMDTLKLT